MFLKRIWKLQKMYTEIDKMHNGVNCCKEGDKGSAHFMQIDVTVKRKDIDQTVHPQPSNATT